jgi:hypothetical protein
MAASALGAFNALAALSVQLHAVAAAVAFATQHSSRIAFPAPAQLLLLPDRAGRVMHFFAGPTMHVAPVRGSRARASAGAGRRASGDAHALQIQP